MGLTVNALVCKLEGEQLISTNINKNKNKKQNEQDSSFRYCLAHFLCAWRVIFNYSLLCSSSSLACCTASTLSPIANCFSFSEKAGPP